MNAMTATLEIAADETRIADVAVFAANIDFATALKAQMAKDVRELTDIETKIGVLEARAKELKGKFAETGHDVVYAGNQLVTVSRSEDSEILDADALLAALGMTKDAAIAEGYSKSKSGSVTVKVGKLGRTNGPSQKIKDGKRVFIAEPLPAEF